MLVTGTNRTQKAPLKVNGQTNSVTKCRLDEFQASRGDCVVASCRDAILAGGGNMICNGSLSLAAIDVAPAFLM